MSWGLGKAAKGRVAKRNERNGRDCALYIPYKVCIVIFGKHYVKMINLIASA